MMKKLTLAPALLALTVLSSGLTLGLTLGLAGCDNDPGKDKARATVSDPVASAPVTTQAMAPSAAMSGAAPAMAAGSASATAPTGGVKYTFSQAGSKVEWTGAKITGKHDGSFEAFTGTVTIPDGKPENGSVTVDIDTTTLKTDPAKLGDHLKSPDFFDVQKFPKATFASTGVKAGGDKGATHTITGNLTLHGVTKTISFPATVKVAGDDVTVNAEFVINRKDFNLVYPGKPNDLIKDDVAIRLTIDAKKS